MKRTRLTGPSTIAETGPRSTSFASVESFDLPSQTTSDFAAAATPHVASLARGLENDPKRIYDYVHDHIRYEHYFGSKKGAQLTLLERGGNDFDQAALLASLLRCAGYTNLTYQFGTVIMPYDTTNHQDFKHWVGATMVNNKWNDTNDTLNSTLWFISSLNYDRGFPTTLEVSGDTNRFIFHHLWVNLTLGGTNYLLDPSFKVSEPISGINLDSAMGLSTNDLTSAASSGSSGTADYIQNLNEAALRGKLRDYTTNLLAYFQSSAPNASVEEILGGRRIVSSADQPLGAALPYQIYSSGGGSTSIEWSAIPTDYMSVLWLDFDTTSQMFYLPELQGERLSLTYNSNGLAQLWLGDEEVLQEASSGSSAETVYLSVDHPHGQWSFFWNTWVYDGHNDDDYVPATYVRTNANYDIMYAFDPDPAWLRKRQEQLDVYRTQGLSDSSREVQTESLNIMGLNWFIQTDLIQRSLAIQGNVMKLNHHRLGRMGQADGQGYFIDAYLQRDSSDSADGIAAAATDKAYQILDLSGYFSSAAEHGIIEQTQSTNAPAASTVKLLQMGNANFQRTFLASSNNWSTVSPQLTNYNTSYLGDLVGSGFYLLLPQDGAIAVAGSGSWRGAGLVELLDAPTFRYGKFEISGGYNGAFSAYPNLYFDPVLRQYTFSPTFYYPGSPFVWSPTAGDPVRMLDGALDISSTDLTLGQREPRGISFARYYSPTRRHHNQANLGNGWTHSYNFNLAEVNAALPSLGGTTPAQMAPMLVATRTAIALYRTQPDPKNWLTTALIANWAIDQLLNNSVSITLGNDAIQFIKQPDGSFTPPASCTWTLTKPSAYVLQERHGNTFKFSSSGLLTNITDQYSQPLNLAYNSSNWLQTVTDWKSRSLTFNYGGSPQRLTSISDGTRSVSYGYTGGDLTSVTDPENKTRTFTYDTNHQVTAIFDALNRLVVTNIYDGFGRVITQYTRGDTNQTWQYFWSGFHNVMQDPAGARQRFFYDDKSRFIAHQDALGNLKQTIHDGQDHVVTSISPLNETNQFVFDANHNLISTIDPLGYTSRFVYDNQNNLTQSVDARGNTNLFGYNAKFQLIGSTNAIGNWATNFYNATDGTLSTRTDAGGTTSFGYDAYGQLSLITYPASLGSEGFLNNALGDTLSHTNGRGFFTSFQYNNRRELTNTIAPTNLTAKVAFDAVGNVLSTTDPRGFSTTNTWSATRKLLATTLPSTPQGVPVITNIYDARDWLAKTLNPLQQPTLYTNDIAGRLFSVTDPLLRTVNFGYDADGRRTATTNAALEVTSQRWSARGELTNMTDAATNLVSRVHDAAGNQNTLTNRNGKKWQFQFDAANRLTNTITPLNRQTTLAYDTRGLLFTVREPSTQMATNLFDARGRLTNVTDTMGVRLYSYDPNNNLTGLTNVGQASSLSWTYDAYERVSTYKDADGNLIQYRYDANGNMTNLVYPGGKTVKYFYDSLNRLTNVTDWASRQTSLTYDPASRLKTISRPNGTQRIITYDAAGQTTNIIEQAVSGNIIAFFKMNWNNAARVEWEFGAPLPHACTPPTRTMTFDDDNRLATFNGSTVTYDLDGNMTWGPGTNNTLTGYSYDARNRLLTAGGLTHGYDALGNRTVLTNGAAVTKFIINPNAPLSQVLFRVKNGVTNYYVYGLGLLYETDDSGNTKTYHYDYRGSTVALTDGSANVTDRTEYGPYGTTTYRSGTTDTPFLFDGRYGVQTDPNGLLYMRARYYNPYICRFLNPDPAGFSGGLNFYAYADGNPVSMLDPFGLGAGDEPSTSFWLNVRANWTGDIAGFARGYIQSNDALSKSLLLRAVKPLDAAYDDVTGLVNLIAAFASDPGGFVSAKFNNLLNSLKTSEGIGEATHNVIVQLAMAELTGGAGSGNAAKGVLADANLAQKTFSQAFSSEGAFAGRTVDDVAAALRSGQMSAADVPIQYIVRDGNTLMLNTRSAQALEAAGIPRAQWNTVNMTGDAAAEARLTGQLHRNGLGSQGTPTVTPGRR